MLFPIIKDLNYIITNFLQMVYISSTSLGDYYLDWKLNSLSHILPTVFPSSETIDKDNPILFIFKTMIFFLLKIQDFIVYFFSFKWLALADFSYLNVSVPENFWQSLPKVPPIYEYSNWIFLMFQKATRFLDMLEEKVGYKLLSKIPKDPFFYEDYNYIKYPPNMDKTNMVFSDSYQTISDLPKTLLESSWFDSISTPLQIFGFSGVKYDQLHRTANEYGFLSQSNLGLLCFLVLPMAISIFFKSFLNSFLINLPLSISKIVSLRYFNVNSPYYNSDVNKWEASTSVSQSSFGRVFSFFFLLFSPRNAGGNVKKENQLSIIKNLQANVSILSVLGIVVGEICFSFLLILPPPFIQFTLSYLDSIWPYIFGLGLIVFVISEGIKTNIITLWTNTDTRNVSLNIKKKSFQVFLVCFLLSLTEQSCCFSYFGSLNLNSTANFFDTYVFSASISPIIFIFSCLGFLIGSIIAITVYNFCLSQLLYFLFLVWRQKKKILLFIFSSKRYTSFRYRNWWHLPNFNLKRLLSINTSFIFQFRSLIALIYKIIQPVNKFLNFFSVINSYFASMFSLLINKITGYAPRKTNIATSRPTELMSATTFDYNSFNLSVYPPFSSAFSQNISPIGREGSYKTSLTSDLSLKNKITNFGTLLKKNKPLNWYILTGIDQFLVICLVIFSFTTIPFYSMDFMVNKFFGFIPQDQILNNYNLNNAMPDYGNNLGIKVNINYFDPPYQIQEVSSLLQEIALFDQNNYGNIIWKTNFENLNYRNALHLSRFAKKNNQQKSRKKFLAPIMIKLRNKLFPYYQGLKNNSKKQKGLTKNVELIQASRGPKKNIFLVDSRDFLNDNLRNKNIKNFEEAFSVISSKVLNSDPAGFSRWSRYWGERIIIDDPIEYTSAVTFSPLTLDEYKKPVRSDQSLEESDLKKPFAYKYFHNPISKRILSNDLKNFLKHQPLSQQLTDVQEKDLALLRVKMAHYYDSLRFYFNLKNHVHHLKNSFEQQATHLMESAPLTNLGIKDSLQIQNQKKDVVSALPAQQNKTFNDKTISPFIANRNAGESKKADSTNLEHGSLFPEKEEWGGSEKNQSSNLKQDNQKVNRFFKNLQFPPMIAKSISSLNYHQQFKGTYEVVRELYDISLYNNKNTNHIFPEQTPKSETFLEDYDDEEKPKLNTTANTNKNFALSSNEKETENSSLPSSEKKSSDRGSRERENFTLSSQNFDQQAKISYKFFKTSQNSEKTNDSKGTKNLDNIKLREIKEATLGINDSLISRIKNRLYQIDPDIVTNSIKNFLPSNGWLADRKALLSYDKSLFNEYDYNKEYFLPDQLKNNNDSLFENASVSESNFLSSDSNSYYYSSPKTERYAIKAKRRDSPIMPRERIDSFYSPEKFLSSYSRNSNSSLLNNSMKKIKHASLFPPKKISAEQERLNFALKNSESSKSRLRDFIKMNKKIKESTNPFYVGWDKNSRKFILTSRIIHRPYYLTQQIKNSENLQFNQPDLENQSINSSKQLDNGSFSKPQMTEYYSSWPFMGEKITSIKSNKYSGLYTNRRFISDNPKNKPGNNLQKYYYENFPYVEFLPAEMVQDYAELFDYYYYKNKNSIKQIFPRLYMPNNILKFYAPAANYKQTLLSPTSSTFLWSGTQDISSNYPIALLVNIEQKLLGYETLYLDQKIQERQQYRIKYLRDGGRIDFKSETYFSELDEYIKFFKQIFRAFFSKTWYNIVNYQNHITRNFEINETAEKLYWYNYEHIITYNRARFFTEHLYPQELEEDFFGIPNKFYPIELQYTLGEIRTIQQGYDDGIEYSDDHKIPSTIERTRKPSTKNL